MPDIEYECIDCHETFVFTEGEQKYYQDRGLAIPKRCPKCRLRRRAEVRPPRKEAINNNEKK